MQSGVGFNQFVLTTSRDVAAGIAILLEAGGLVTTANPPDNPDTAPIEDFRLGSRLYLAIRCVLAGLIFFWNPAHAF